MKFKQIVAFVVIGLFATTVWSGSDIHQQMKIVIVEDDGNSETRIEIDSKEMGFSLRDMQVGENHSIVDTQGRPILVTRKENSYTLEVDGKTVEMPMFEPYGSLESGHAAAVDMRVMQGSAPPHTMMRDEGVVIVSEQEIDAATQQVIRTALESAGHESVHFVGGDQHGHRVRFVEKVVEVKR